MIISISVGINQGKVSRELVGTTIKTGKMCENTGSFSNVEIRPIITATTRNSLSTYYHSALIPVLLIYNFACLGLTVSNVTCFEDSIDSVSKTKEGIGLAARCRRAWAETAEGMTVYGEILRQVYAGEFGVGS